MSVSLGKLRHLKMPATAVELTKVTSKEFPRLISLVSVIFNITPGQKAILNNITANMLKVWKNSGVKFTIIYLSECLRLVCVYIAEDGVKNKKTWVATYCRTGLPKILGIKGRAYLISLKANIANADPDILRFCRVLITVLSWFRIMSPEHELKFTTVTDPLREGSISLSNRDISNGLRSLGIRRLKTRSPRFIWSNKAGVNTRYSFLSIGLDMLGLICEPQIW